MGVALALGLLTRLAALAGVTMNLAFLWAGTTSTNPPLLLLGLALVFFGHRPGRFGVDGWLFPRLREHIPMETRRLDARRCSSQRCSRERGWRSSLRTW